MHGVCLSRVKPQKEAHLQWGHFFELMCIFQKLFVRQTLFSQTCFN